MNVYSTITAKHPRRRIAAGAALIVIIVDRPLAVRAVPGQFSGALRRRAEAAVPVTVEPARSQDFEVTLDAIGTVTPLSTVTVTSRVSGILTQIFYAEGQMVKKDDLLAVIDPRPYQAALLQAQGQLAARPGAPEQRADRPHAVPERLPGARHSGAAAGDRPGGRQGDEGSVKLDQGNLDAAQVNVDYTRILSPINGRVGLRMVDAGNIVAANGAKGLVTIAQVQPITVIFTLAQGSARRGRGDAPRRDRPGGCLRPRAGSAGRAGGHCSDRQPD